MVEQVSTAELESPHISPKGALRTIFANASDILEEQELSVFSKIALRAEDVRMTPDVVAAQEGMAPQDVVGIHNRAVRKLCEYYQTQGSVLAGFFSELPEERQTQPEQIVDHAPVLATIYNREAATISPNVILSRLFDAGPSVLEPDEYDVVIRTDLRAVKHREAPETIAQQMNAAVEDILRLRDAAMDKLRQAVSFEDPNHYNAPVFRPKMV